MPVLPLWKNNSEQENKHRYLLFQIETKTASLLHLIFGS